MFKRIANLIRGFFGLFIGGMEKRNPEALLEVEKENLRKQIAQFNQGLASHAGLCEQLVSQEKNLETQERDLQTKTAAHLRAGNRDIAGQYALRLQTVTQQLDENHQQLETAEKTYRELVRARDISIKAAQDKIEALKHDLSDLKIKQATAELNEMASGMIGSIGGAGDTLDRLTNIVSEQRDKATGRARVAHDAISTQSVELTAIEYQALQEQALADFAAKAGIPLERKAIEQGPEAPKLIGPEGQ